MRKFKEQSILTKLLLFLFICQFLAIAFINLTQLQYHLGFDYSINFLKTIQIAKQHKLVIDHWQSTTGYSLLDVNILAVPFYAITKNIFVAFGIANTLMISITSYVFWKIFRVLHVNVNSALIGLNFFICSFATIEFNNSNDLGYASDMLIGSNYYAMTMLLVLFALLYLWSDLSPKKQWIYGIILTALITLLSATNGLLIWGLFLVPVCLYDIINAFAYNDIGRMKSRVFIFGVANVILSPVANILYSIGGTGTSGLELVTVGLFWENIGNIFAGIVKFLGGLPLHASVSPTSIYGIAYASACGIVVLLFVGVGYGISRLIKKKSTEQINFLIWIITENILFFAFVNTRYGEEIFECRYLLTIIYAMLILMVLFLDHLFTNDKIKFNIVSVMVALVLLVLDVVGDKIIYTTRIDYEQLKQVAEYVQQSESPVVYVCNDEIVARRMRVIDTEKVYRNVLGVNATSAWGEYLFFQDNAEYTGEHYLIVVNGQRDCIPEWLYNMYTHETNIGGYEIYHADMNRFDFSTEIESHTIDFPYSLGYATYLGTLDEKGAFVTDGTEGYCLAGPEQPVEEPGLYSVKLSYEIDSMGVGDNIFEVVANGGTELLGQCVLDDSTLEVILSNVVFSESDTISYRVYNANGSVMKINYIEVTKIDD